LKQCKRCEETKPLAAFYKARGCVDGTRHVCKVCFNRGLKETRDPVAASSRSVAWQKANRGRANANKRWSALSKIHRIPSWADRAAIQAVYEACPEGLEVDHMVPLDGDSVSGLHVVENLQYLTKAENSGKRNKYLQQ